MAKNLHSAILVGLLLFPPETNVIKEFLPEILALCEKARPFLK